MADRGRGEIVVDAPIEDVWEVAADLEALPTWAPDVKHAVVLTRDDRGRPETAEFRVGGYGITVSYTLRYTHDHPARLSWTLEHSNELRRMDGEYRFAAADGGGTHVEYLLEVDLRIPVLGMIKRRAERTIIDHALKGLKAEAERDDRT